MCFNMKGEHIKNATQNMGVCSKCYPVGIFFALYVAFCLDVAGTTTCVLTVM
jgi:hypothetical protein